MAKNQYVLTIELTGGGGDNQDGASGDVAGGSTSTRSKTKTEETTWKLVAKGMALMTAKKAVNYTTSRIGTWTGNVKAQEIANTAQKAIGYTAALAINPYLGLAAIALDATTSAIDTGFKIRWNNKEAAENARRLGYINSSNRV